MSQLIKKKKFFVVNFYEEDRYSVVPYQWLSTDKEHCYWPGKKTKNKEQIQKDPDSSPDSLFALYPAKFIKSYGKINL